MVRCSSWRPRMSPSRWDSRRCRTLAEAIGPVRRFRPRQRRDHFRRGDGRVDLRHATEHGDERQRPLDQGRRQTKHKVQLIDMVEQALPRRMRAARRAIERRLVVRRIGQRTRAPSHDSIGIFLRIFLARAQNHEQGGQRFLRREVQVDARGLRRELDQNGGAIQPEVK